MFITFEGPDGSGKTTALEGLLKYLKTKLSADKYVFTREPGGTDIKAAEKIRKIILDKDNIIDNKSEVLLYAASRRLHLEGLIWPSLKAHKIVFCDRYIDSSLAYQGMGREVGIDFVRDINNKATDSTWPDLTIFFDISPQNAMARTDQRAPKDRLELAGPKFHERVYQGYKAIIKADPKRFKIVDATKSIADVLVQVIKIIDEVLAI